MDALKPFPAVTFYEPVIPPGTKEGYATLIKSCFHEMFVK